MTRKRLQERREMMSRAWKMGFKARVIAEMFRVKPGVVRMEAYHHREMFPHRIDCHDLIVNRRVAR